MWKREQRDGHLNIWMWMNENYRKYSVDVSRDVYFVDINEVQGHLYSRLIRFDFALFS